MDYKNYSYFETIIVNPCTYLQKGKSVTYGNHDYSHSKWHYEITRNHQCVLLPPGNDVNQLSESDLSEVLK
jgi:hypothetical protein